MSGFNSVFGPQSPVVHPQAWTDAAERQPRPLLDRLESAPAARAAGNPFAPQAPAPQVANHAMQAATGRVMRVFPSRSFTAADMHLFTIGHQGRRWVHDGLARAVIPNFALVSAGGDGNCGFYALFAGLVYHAVDFEGSRRRIVNCLRALGSAANRCEAGFSRVQQELGYPGTRGPHALSEGKRALLALAAVIEQYPEHAIAMVQARGLDVEKACYVLRATAIQDSVTIREKLDRHALVNDDLAPLAQTFGVYLIVPTVDPAQGLVWTPERLSRLAEARYAEGTIHLLNSHDHFDLLLPRRC